ncbi:hypothetical protein QR680_013132 [Steinernema hermaphroditum]|uniref:Uncharacterized protein n=1 Tax=Steinernema hermaphroditum TaxID=289476 RepID=A0AA39I6U1_9BILA|nr:hypothetical protein QR680_013132 [Steinernema hermaphroditum]
MYKRVPDRKFRKEVIVFEDKKTKRVMETFDSRSIVPYNPYLLLKYGSHINVEYCSSVEAVRYIHKYIFKGSEYCFVGLKSGRQVAMNLPDGIEVHYDEGEEVDLFRTLSAHEDYLRIMAVQITDTSHFVDFLPVHMKENRFVTFREHACDEGIAEQTLKPSKLDAFFDFWKENSKLPNKEQREEQMTYAEFVERYRFNLEKRKWQKRKLARPIIARVQAVPLHKEELFALRALLMVVKAPKSFEHLKDGHETYSARA